MAPIELNILLKDEQLADALHIVEVKDNEIVLQYENGLLKQVLTAGRYTFWKEVINYDLIKEQIKIAAGHKVSGINYFPQMHAIECRINAEDPYNDFRPSPGKITVLHTPGGHGVRVDSHVYAGYVIPPYYDSMIGKLITVARTREEAIDTMYRALSEYVIEGVKTTIPFHLQLMQNEDFRKGNFTTKFLETFEMQKGG